MQTHYSTVNRFTLGALLLAAIASGAAALANTAQSPAAQPYAGQQARAIKALDEQDQRALREGQGIGSAKVAELNSYPGPSHVLDLRERLQLSPEQEAATRRLMTEHKARARQLGEHVIAAERRLDALFAERRANPAAVQQATRDVALLQGELRAEHLNTHLEQTALLRTEQVRRYNELRGYTSGAGQPQSLRPGHSGHSGHRH